MLRPAMYRKNNNELWSDPFGMFDDMFPGFWNNDGLEKSFAGFSTDVIENEHGYELQAELPGFKKEDIGIDLKNDILTIKASHTEDNKEEGEGKKYLRKERTYQSYQRSFRVENITAEDIDASYQDGILTVKFPKRDALPEQEIKKIAIK